jgi:hypothetical protein
MIVSDLSEIEQFPYLEELICDNNEISEKSRFPKLESLKLFSCNKNKVSILKLMNLPFIILKAAN